MLGKGFWVSMGVWLKSENPSTPDPSTAFPFPYSHVTAAQPGLQLSLLFCILGGTLCQAGARNTNAAAFLPGMSVLFPVVSEGHVQPRSVAVDPEGASPLQQAAFV